MNTLQKRTLGALGTALGLSAPFALEALHRRADRRRLTPDGMFSTVRGRKMHIATHGAGPKTLVFLPGLGTPCPAIDFVPLAARLRGHFRCVVPEPLGRGFSDAAGTPRTSLHIVAELREGLLGAGLRPPFVLVAHGVSGIYALVWAAHYPAEVEAVVGIDAYVPALADAPACVPRPLPRLCALANLSGLVRLSGFLPAGTRRLRALCGGNPARLSAVRSISSRCTLSRNELSERALLWENLRHAQKLHFPKACRLLHFVAQDSVQAMSGGPACDWEGEHRRQTLAVSDGRCLTLGGGHFLHHTQADAMAREIRAFLAEETAPAPKRRRSAVVHRP